MELILMLVSLLLILLKESVENKTSEYSLGIVSFTLAVPQQAELLRENKACEDGSHSLLVNGFSEFDSKR